MGYLALWEHPVYYQSEKPNFAQVEPSFLLFVFAAPDIPRVRKPPARLRINQRKELVRVLFLGFVRKAVEESLTGRTSLQPVG